VRSPSPAIACRRHFRYFGFSIESVQRNYCTLFVDNARSHAFVLVCSADQALASCTHHVHDPKPSRNPQSTVLLVAQPLHYPPDQATVWVRMDGTVLLACSNFEDWTGFTTRDIQGISFLSMVAAGAPVMQE
jgi:hypothetical protein